MVVKNGSSSRSLYVDVDAKSEKGSKERVKGVELVVETIPRSEFGALDPLAGQNGPAGDDKCVPPKVNGPCSRVKDALLDTLDHLLPDGARVAGEDAASNLLIAKEEEKVAEERCDDRDKKATNRAAEFGVLSLGRQEVLLLGRHPCLDWSRAAF